MVGRRVQKFRGTLPSSVYTKSDGVNGNEYHTVYG